MTRNHASPLSPSRSNALNAYTIGCTKFVQEPRLHTGLYGNDVQNLEKVVSDSSDISYFYQVPSVHKLNLFLNIMYTRALKTCLTLSFSQWMLQNESS